MTSPRVHRHREAEADRCKVNTRGRRVRRRRTPAPPAPPRRKARYQKTSVLGSFSGMCVALFAATGSIFWAVGGVATGAGGAAAAWFEYRRDLLEVKRTGRPIGAPAPAKPKAGDPIPPGVKPVDLDPPATRKPQPRSTRKPQPRSTRKPGSDHAAKCKANPPGGPTCRCVDGPNRKGKTTTKRATTRKRTTK